MLKICDIKAFVSDWQVQITAWSNVQSNTKPTEMRSKMQFTVWTLWSETKLRVCLPSYLSYLACFKAANLLEKSFCHWNAA